MMVGTTLSAITTWKLQTYIQFLLMFGDNHESPRKCIKILFSWLFSPFNVTLISGVCMFSGSDNKMNDMIASHILLFGSISMFCVTDSNPWNIIGYFHTKYVPTKHLLWRRIMLCKLFIFDMNKIIVNLMVWSPHWDKCNELWFKGM